MNEKRMRITDVHVSDVDRNISVSVQSKEYNAIVQRRARFTAETRVRKTSHLFLLLTRSTRFVGLR
jgi:hypothetical protein